MPEWDEQGNPVQEWDEQGKPLGASSGGENALQRSLRGARIERAPGFWEKVGQDVKDFGSELPLMGYRALDFLGGKTNDPTLEAERAARTKKINDLLGAAPEGTGPEMRFGRIAARMVPGVVAATATSGLSLPAQAAIQGGVQGLQTLSEGADPTTAATAGGIAALGPLVAGGANAVATKAKNPFAGSVDRAALGTARRVGVELPAGAVTTSPVARGIEQMSSRMLGGGGIEARGLKAGQDIGEAAGALSAGADSTVAGQGVLDDFTAARSAAQATKNAEYGKVGNLTGIPTDPRETLGLIDSLLAQGTLDPDTLANLRKLREAVAPKPPTNLGAGQWADDPNMAAIIAQQDARTAASAAPTPRSVADLMSQQAGIEYGGPNAMRDAGLGNKLRDALGKDYTAALEGAAPDQAAQLAKAKGAYGEYADLTDSAVGKAVGANQKTVDKIPGALLRSTTSRADLQRLMEVSTPETRQELQRVVLRQIVGDGQSLTPKAIARGLKTPNLDVILDPEQLQRLKDLSALRQALARTTIGSPTAPLLQSRKYIDMVPRLLAAVAGGAAGSVPGAIAAMAAEAGGEAAIARWIGSEAGQRWLTTGLGPATLPGKLAKAPFVAGARMPSELSLDQRRRRAELDALLGQTR